MNLIIVKEHSLATLQLMFLTDSPQEKAINMTLVFELRSEDLQSKNSMLIAFVVDFTTLRHVFYVAIKSFGNCVFSMPRNGFWE